MPLSAPLLEQTLRGQMLEVIKQPHRPLPQLPGLLLPEIDQGRTKLLDEVVLCIATVGWCAVRLGANAATLAGAALESTRAFPLMRPGKVVDPATGAVRSGVDPCGVPRGDRFSQVHDETVLRGGASRWPALYELDSAIERVGVALAQTAKKYPSLLPFELTGSSDGMIACFPGNGAEYGPHLDSNLHRGHNSGLDPRKLTCICYLNAGWREADGGALCIHDPEGSCWHTVLPSADTLVLFRSDLVLHRVAAAHKWRHALTVFFQGEYTDAGPGGARSAAAIKAARSRRVDLQKWR